MVPGKWVCAERSDIKRGRRGKDRHVLPAGVREIRKEAVPLLRQEGLPPLLCIPTQGSFVRHAEHSPRRLKDISDMSLQRSNHHHVTSTLLQKYSWMICTT